MFVALSFPKLSRNGVAQRAARIREEVAKKYGKPFNVLLAESCRKEYQYPYVR
jgi:hypothetical protein